MTPFYKEFEAGDRSILRLGDTSVILAHLSPGSRKSKIPVHLFVPMSLTSRCQQKEVCYRGR